MDKITVHSTRAKSVEARFAKVFGHKFDVPSGNEDVGIVCDFLFFSHAFVFGLVMVACIKHQVTSLVILRPFHPCYLKKLRRAIRQQIQTLSPRR